MENKRVAEQLRFAAKAAVGGFSDYQATYYRPGQWVTVSPLPPIDGPVLPDCFLVGPPCAKDLRVGMIIDVTPAEWQDALLAALTELAAGEDAALAASEPAAAWQDDVAEHSVPAYIPDERDCLTRIEGERVMVRIGQDVVPVSVEDARAMGCECASVGV